MRLRQRLANLRQAVNRAKERGEMFGDPEGRKLFAEGFRPTHYHDLGFIFDHVDVWLAAGNELPEFDPTAPYEPLDSWLRQHDGRIWIKADA